MGGPGIRLFGYPKQCFDVGVSGSGLIQHRIIHPISAGSSSPSSSSPHTQMILDAVEQVGGIYVVTADHGNAEDMVKRNKNGEPLLDKNGQIQILTSHTLQPVPIAIGGPGLLPGVCFRKDVSNGGLANVAATVMNLHGFEAPSDYETTLIEVA